MEINRFKGDVNTDDSRSKRAVSPFEVPVEYDVDDNFYLNKSQVDYKQLIKHYVFDYWYLYLVFIPICLLLAYSYTRIVEPTYAIQSKIQIKEGESDFGAPEDWLRKSLNFTSVSESMANEIQLLSSFSLMRSVVDALNLNVKYQWKNGLVTREGYKDFPVAVDSFSLISDDPSGLTVDIIPVDQFKFRFVKDSLIGVYGFDRLFTNPFGTFKITKNGNLRLGSDSLLQIIFMNPDAVTETYQRNLKLELPDEKSSMVEIVLEDAVPDRGIHVVTTLLSEYERLKDDENNQTLGSILQFLDTRLADVSQSLKSIESRVEQYKVANKVTASSTSDLDIVLKNVNRLVEEQRDLEYQLKVIAGMEGSVASNSSGFDLISANVSSVSREIYDLIEPYNKLVLDRQQLLNSANLSNPVIQSNTEKLIELRKSIARAIKEKQREINLKIETISNQYREATLRLRNIPTLERNLADVEREKSIVENLYIYLLQKREEAALAEISSSKNFKLIDRPRSSIEPVSPNLKVVYLGGFLLGTGMPIGIIFLLTFFKRSVSSMDEIRNLMPRRTILGMVIQYRGKEQNVVREESNTIISENFRSLRANLDFNERGRHQCILVTSSTKYEGKTFVASNLACSFALAGRKTIVIDFDLRNPDLSKYLSSDKNQDSLGVSSFLEGKSKIKEIIRQSKLSPNLSYISGGEISKNSAELLYEAKLHKLFSRLKKHFDIIIVDTPPIGIIADATLLSHYVTKSLFVIRYKVTDKTMLEYAKNFFDHGKLINPSIIVNGVTDKRAYTYGKYA